MFEKVPLLEGRKRSTAKKFEGQLQFHVRSEHQNDPQVVEISQNLANF